MPVLEQLTRETLLIRDDTRGDFDLTLLPLGLVYARSPTTSGMPLVDVLLAESVERADWPVVARVVDASAPVGFYQADLVLRSLRPMMGALLGDPGVRRALASTLGATRTFWFDEVDLFLRDTGVGADFRQQVASETRPEHTVGLVARVGLHTGAVHHALTSPTIREHLLRGGFRDLAASSSPRQFLTLCTRRVLRLLRQADFEPIRWAGSTHHTGDAS